MTCWYDQLMWCMTKIGTLISSLTITGNSNGITVRNLLSNALLDKVCWQNAASLLLLTVFFVYGYIATVAPSRVYKLLSLFQLVAQRAVFMRVSPDVDSAVEQTTDLASSWGDKSTVQHSAVFHLVFPLLALFMYICPCLAFSLLLAQYQCSDIFSYLFQPGTFARTAY